MTGGAFGSLLGQVLRVTPSERKILLACRRRRRHGGDVRRAARRGRARDRAAAVRVLEPRRSCPLDRRRRASPAPCTRRCSGNGPLFDGAAARLRRTRDRCRSFAVARRALRIARGRGVQGAVRGRARLPPIADTGVLAPGPGRGGVRARSGSLVPRALGVGYDAIDDVLANRLAVGTLVVLVLGKLVIWWLALGSGTSGGTLAPILLISGCVRRPARPLVNEVLPDLHLSPGAVALVAMAATFGASTRAAFTAIVFAFELTHDYRRILPMMLAAVIADIVAGAAPRRRPDDREAAAPRSAGAARLRGRTSSRPRGSREHHDHADVVTMRSDATVDDARREGSSRRSPQRLPARRRGRPLRRDRHPHGSPQARGEREHPRRSRCEPRRRDRDRRRHVLTVLERILDEAVDHVPVLDADRTSSGSAPARTSCACTRSSAPPTGTSPVGTTHCAPGGGRRHPVRSVPRETPRERRPADGRGSPSSRENEALARFRHALRASSGSPSRPPGTRGHLRPSTNSCCRSAGTPVRRHP